MIVYLKSIDGTKTRFDSMKALFLYLEAEFSKEYYYYSHYSCNYDYKMYRAIGNEFKSEARAIRSGFQDVRNPVCCLSEKYRWKAQPSIFSSYIRHDLWLACDCKYIVLDDKGRVISRELVLERYRQRLEALFVRKHARRYGMGISSSVPRSGYKFSKNQRKRIRKRYKATSFNGDEARAFDSRDEFDLTVKGRDKRRSVVKSLWLRDYDYYNHTECGRSWKQCKKRKQWM